MRFTLDVGGAEQPERVLKRIANLRGVHYARRKK
jgi:hypothetical protein